MQGSKKVDGRLAVIELAAPTRIRDRIKGHLELKQNLASLLVKAPAIQIRARVRVRVRTRSRASAGVRF